jgi:hypothetical protein
LKNCNKINKMKRNKLGMSVSRRCGADFTIELDDTIL